MSEISITPANVKPSAAAQLLTITLGATLTAGMVAYPDAITGKYLAARANAAATAAIAGMGILATGGGDGQKGVLVLKDDALEIGGTVSDAAVLALSYDAAGAIVPAVELTEESTICYQVIFGTGLPSNKVKVDFTRAIVGQIAAAA